MKIMSGWGWTAFVLPVLVIGVVADITDGIYGRDTYANSTLFPAIALWVGGTLLVVWGLFINRKTVVLVDEDRQSKWLAQRSNDFFFLPVWAWGVLWTAFGMLMLFDP